MSRIALSFLILLATVPAAGQTLELIGGWEGSPGRGYAFVAPVYTFLDRPSWAVQLRGSVSHLYYAFPEGGATTDVVSPGASLGVGFRRKIGRANLTISPGYEARRTRRTLQGLERRFDERGWTLQGELFFQRTPLTTIFLIGAWGDANEYLWTRAGYKRQISNTDFRGPVSVGLGLELTAQGNRDLTVHQAGPMIELAFPRTNLSLQFRGGYAATRYSSGLSETATYFGAGFYRRF